tara:strand:- start:655 stop:876 length:222 start_codon:yes stop_codon:yes gene_type:complete
VEPVKRGTCFTGSRGFTDPDRFYLDGLIKEPTYILIAISGPNDDFSISKFLYGFKFYIWSEICKLIVDKELED